MPENFVTVATYLSSVEASLARNRLEEAGIPAFLSGEEMVDMAWVLGNAVGGIKLQVPETDLEQARAALAEESAADDEPGEDELLQSDSSDPSITTKPVRQVPSAAGEAVERVEGDDEEQDFVNYSAGEELATRAFRAAVFGCFTLPGIFHLYSVYVLFQLGGWDGELSPAGSRRAVTALLIDLVVLLLAGVVLVGNIPYLP